MPKVTVLMSVYDGEAYLEEAIESILLQTWTDHEFLIINDGSADKSREIIRSFDDPRIHLVENAANLGLARSLNRGLKLARGELIARQDADDVSHPTRLERQIRFMNAHPDVALLGTQARRIQQRWGFITSPATPAALNHVAIKWRLMFSNAFAHTSVMFRRGVIWEQHHGYDERFLRAQDYELWSRIAQGHEVRSLGRALVDCRSHSETITANRERIQPGVVEGIIWRNLKRFSGFCHIPREWAVLINSLRTGRIKEPDQLMAVMNTVFSQFCATHPNAVAEPEIRRHLAFQLGLIAYYTVGLNRTASARAFWRACQRDIRTVVQSIASRATFVGHVALWMGGESVRRARSRVGGGGAPSSSIRAARWPRPKNDPSESESAPRGSG